MVPAEMPSDSADTLARCGTVILTLIMTSWPARTLNRGRFPECEGGRPLTVTLNVTLNGAVAGHDAPAGQRGDEEHPPAASTPASSAATRTARRTPITRQV
jgi:hypothetical protein